MDEIKAGREKKNTRRGVEETTLKDKFVSYMMEPVRSCVHADTLARLSQIKTLNSQERNSSHGKRDF